MINFLDLRKDTLNRSTDLSFRLSFNFFLFFLLFFFFFESVIFVSFLFFVVFVFLVIVGVFFVSFLVIVGVFFVCFFSVLLFFVELCLCFFFSFFFFFWLFFFVFGHLSCHSKGVFEQTSSPCLGRLVLIFFLEEREGREDGFGK